VPASRIRRVAWEVVCIEVLLGGGGRWGGYVGGSVYPIVLWGPSC